MYLQIIDKATSQQSSLIQDRKEETVSEPPLKKLKTHNNKFIPLKSSGESS